jgi:hypothetical protein
MRAIDFEFPFRQDNAKLNRRMPHTLYIRLEKKCHPKCEVNLAELHTRVSRRIYIRDISRHKSGDISCMSPRARTCAADEITPKGMWVAVNV